MSASTVSANEAPRARQPRSVLNWFWRARELDAARRAEHQTLTETGQRLRHALAASELASKVLEGVDPLRAEPGHWLASSLYREAAYWALLAQDEALQASTLAEAMAATPPALLVFAAGGDGELEAVRRALLPAEGPQLADEDLDVQTREARLAQAFVEALLRRRQGAVENLHRVLLQRWLRTGGALACIAALAIGVSCVFHQLTKPPDLASGKAWRTSSSAGDCRPEQRSCLGARTRILFHTRTEKNPWFEIDLGEPRAFSVVEVENRDDCCPDVALPLAIEVSDDAREWREVARRTESFDTWRAELPAQRARYVRAHSLRTTALHLVRVSVLER